MSYDINLLDPVTKKTIILDAPHEMKGGTYCAGGTSEAWLNVTYNYGKHYYNLMDKDLGIRVLYGKTGAESIPILKNTIAQLGNETNPNYWEPTEGNAKRALLQLLGMAQLRPDGIWDGD